MEITDKLIFLRYAAPCVDDFVMQGLMPKQYAKDIIGATQQQEVLEDSEKQFDLAYIMCQHTARKLNTDIIDAGVIRAYYLNTHNKIIGIHKPVACSAEECKILVSKKRGAYNESFFRRIHKNNLVVHRGYVVDLLTDSELGGIISRSSFLETH